MMISGLGIDLVEIERIERSLARHGAGFVQRVFTPLEISYCSAMQQPAAFYAARFAAKEAVAKALGTGIGAACGWLDIEVRRKASGEPFVVLHGAGQATAERLGISTILLSLSHTEHYAVAQAIAIGEAK
jgi:holo-[acyl-carrier protein] synthase